MAQRFRLPGWAASLLTGAAGNAVWALLVLLSGGVISVVLGIGGAIRLPWWSLLLLALGGAAIVLSVAGLLVVARGASRLTGERDELASQLQIARSALQLAEQQRAEATRLEAAARDELRRWRPDGIAGEMLYLAFAEFPNLSVIDVRSIAQLLDHSYRHPFTEVPLEVQASADQKTAAVSLWPVAVMVERPAAEATILAGRLHSLIEQMRNRAHQDARGAIG